jgi:hypothetical protein
VCCRCARRPTRAHVCQLMAAAGSYDYTYYLIPQSTVSMQTDTGPCVSSWTAQRPDAALASTGAGAGAGKRCVCCGTQDSSPWSGWVNLFVFKPVVGLVGDLRGGGGRSSLRTTM